jgi:hypothetical protein
MVSFQTKNTNLGQFWGIILEDADIFYGHLVHFVFIWCPALVSCAEINLAALVGNVAFFRFQMPQENTFPNEPVVLISYRKYPDEMVF